VIVEKHLAGQVEAFGEAEILLTPTPSTTTD